MKGQFRSVPFGAAELVGLGGVSWQSEAGLPAPRIWGVRGPGYSSEEDCVGLEIQQPAGPMFVSRQPGERFYCGLDPSLVQRVAREHGTAQDWWIRYRS